MIESIVKSTKQDNRPSFQFYPKDWLTDIGLRMCSLEAKGLWIDLLCYMFFAPIRGSLTYNKTITNDNKVITKMDNKAIAKLLGENEQKVDELIKELEENQVIEKLPNALRINRKMYYGTWGYSKVSEVRAEAGRKGMQSRWHNKKITKITASSSSSSSSSREKEIYKEKEISKPKVVRFQKPSIQDISAYVQEKGYNIDPEGFFDFYESKGWFVGKNKMKDWRAAVRNWERMRTKRETQEKSEIDNYKEA